LIALIEARWVDSRWGSFRYAPEHRARRSKALCWLVSLCAECGGRTKIAAIAGTRMPRMTADRSAWRDGRSLYEPGRIL
jgi:hypothetical protein